MLTIVTHSFATRGKWLSNIEKILCFYHAMIKQKQIMVNLATICQQEFMEESQLFQQHPL